MAAAAGLGISSSLAWSEDNSADRIEAMANDLVIIEFKNGEMASGKMTKETGDNIYLAHPDGSMEAPFPRDKIIKVRKPTEEELVKLKELMKEEWKQGSPARKSK